MDVDGRIYSDAIKGNTWESELDASRCFFCIISRRAACWLLLREGSSGHGWRGWGREHGFGR
jgi:hypothetical protein